MVAWSSRGCSGASVIPQQHRGGGFCLWGCLLVRGEHFPQETPHVTSHALPNPPLTRRVGPPPLAEQSFCAGHCWQREDGHSLGGLPRAWRDIWQSWTLSVRNPEHPAPGPLCHTGAPGHLLRCPVLLYTVGFYSLRFSFWCWGGLCLEHRASWRRVLEQNSSWSQRRREQCLLRVPLAVLASLLLNIQGLRPDTTPAFFALFSPSLRLPASLVV